MKKTFFCLLFAPLFSCSITFYPLRGNYPKPPVVVHSNNPAEKVWDNLIDLFAQKGLSIKIIDKSSGLIVSERKSLPFTVEDKNGLIKDKLAFVIIPRMTPEGFSTPILPYRVYGEWNVRVKSEGSGSTININLLNFSADYGDAKDDRFLYYQKYKKKFRESIDGQTTGVFENFIADAIK